MPDTRKYTGLEVGKPCPKCELGKGLRTAFPLELGWTGWDSYQFLHCDICGAFFVAHKGETEYIYLKVRPLGGD